MVTNAVSVMRISDVDVVEYRSYSKRSASNVIFQPTGSVLAGAKVIIIIHSIILPYSRYSTRQEKRFPISHLISFLCLITLSTF